MPGKKSGKTKKLKGRPLYNSGDWKRPLAEGTSSEPWRDECRRDYARIIHSPSFRRLQGKTQLFPGHESDFFRNRLTHSLEVGQIAESIAYRLNGTNGYFEKSENRINERLCLTAGLVHDLGHPPFGHNGEHALDDKMRAYGGFEGNAQTLRILGRLEKKRTDSSLTSIDQRRGLNLTNRLLASTLKYDRKIPPNRGPDDGFVKGYYFDDEPLIDSIKDAVEPRRNEYDGSFKTIECKIMDIADDIAYSTYDLEDSFKAGFINPAAILASPDDLLERVAEKVRKSTRDSHFDRADVVGVFGEMFSDLSNHDDHGKTGDSAIYRSVRFYERSNEIAENGYLRTSFTSQLVGEFINGVSAEPNPEFPVFSEVRLDNDTLKKVEVLKNYTYEATIFSTRLKVAEFRGYEVVASIFDALTKPKGHLLLPDDVRPLYTNLEDDASARMRVICDFIAGMTDRYALEFYGRLHSDSPQSIFKPI